MLATSAKQRIDHVLRQLYQDVTKHCDRQRCNSDLPGGRAERDYPFELQDVVVRRTAQKTRRPNKALEGFPGSRQAVASCDSQTRSCLESSSSRERHLLMRRLNEVSGRRGHKVAHDGGLDADL
jgi:hypothetical protein